METAADNPFAAILMDGETILWQGQPCSDCCTRSDKKERRTISYVILAFLVLAALCSFYTGDRVGLKLCTLYSVLLAPFIVGLLLVPSTAVPKWRYAVTNRQVVFYDPHGDGDDVLTYVPLEDIKKVHLRRIGPRGAKLVFETKFLARHNRLTFYHLVNAAEVQSLVVSLLPSAK